MNNLKEALSDPIWESHQIGDKYQMDNKPDYWEIAYYPIFEDNKSKEQYKTPRALIEKPIIQNGIKIGTDFREVPLRYLSKA